MDHLQYFPQQKFVMINFCCSFKIFQSLIHTSRCIQVGSFLVHDQILVASAGFQAGRYVLQYAPSYNLILLWVIESGLQLSNQTDLRCFTMEYLLHMQFQDSFSLIFFLKCLVIQFVSDRIRFSNIPIYH